MLSIKCIKVHIKISSRCSHRRDTRKWSDDYWTRTSWENCQKLQRATFYAAPCSFL